MTFSLLSVAIIGVSAAIIYKEIKKGYKHGLSRSLIYLATLIFCAVFSSIVSVWTGKLFGDLLFNSLSDSGVFESMGDEFSLMLGVAEILINMVVSLLLYLPVFYLMKWALNRLVGIVYNLVAKKWGNGSKGEGDTQYLPEDAPFYVVHDKKLGAIVGILSGLILTVVVFMPLTGFLKSADDLLDTMQEIIEIPELSESADIQAIDIYANDISGTVIQACGGRGLYDLATRASVNGESTCFNKELEVLRSLELGELVKELENPEEFGIEQIQKLEQTLDKMSESLSMRLIASQFLSEASTRWMEHRSYFGIERPDLGNNSAVNGFFDAILSVCSTTTTETYQADIKTITGLIRIFGEYEVLFEEHDYELFMKKFVEENALQRIEDELNKNPRMRLVSMAIDDLVMDTIASELNSLNFSIEDREVIFRGIASVLNDASGLSGSAQLTSIANGVAEKLEEQGIYIPENVKNRVGEILQSNIPMGGQLTESDIESFFNEYLSGANFN